MNLMRDFGLLRKRDEVIDLMRIIAFIVRSAWSESKLTTGSRLSQLCQSRHIVANSTLNNRSDYGIWGRLFRNNFPGAVISFKVVQ